MEQEVLDRYDQVLTKQSSAYPLKYYNQREELIAVQQRFIPELTQLANSPAMQPLSALEAASSPLQLDQPFFILGFPKSGTTFLNYLLDSHPDLLVLPGDAHYLSTLTQYSRMTPTERLAEMRQYLIRLVIHPIGLSPFWLLSNGEPTWQPYAQLLRYFEDAVAQLATSPLAIWQAALRAFHMANPSAKYWVEKTPSNEQHVAQLLAQYPKAKFVHIVRHPYANLVSMKKMPMQGFEWDVMGYQAAHLRRSMKLAKQNQQQYGTERYLVVHYEKLIADTDNQRDKVAHFLGINPHPNLHHATILGLPATANSSYKDRRGMNQDILQAHERWRDDLEAWELDLIAFLMRNQVANYGYELGHTPTAADYWRAVRRSNAEGKSIQYHRALQYFWESYGA